MTEVIEPYGILPTVAALADPIAEALRGVRYHAVEADLQAAVESALHASPDIRVGLIVREPRLSARDRPDFAVRGIDGLVIVECKVDGGTAAVARQLARYAEYPEVRVLFLATTRLRHDAGVPRVIGGKPVRVVAYHGLP